LTGSPMKGNPTAPITIVEFADFECGMCRMASGPINEFVQANPDVRLVFKNFPLSGHEHAEEAARAAMAADLQGKFWEMHQSIFAAQGLTESALVQMAEGLKLDVEKFKKDIHSEAIADAVSRDRKLGEQVKLTGTPTIFINGRRFTASADLKSGLEEWVGLERKLLGKSAPAPKSADEPQK
jgi:protein-disulfide isomerase